LVCRARVSKRIHSRLSSPLWRLLSHFTNGGDDSGISSTTADVARHAFADFVVREHDVSFFANIGGDVTGVALICLVEHRDCRAELSGRAVATLKTLVTHECRLQRMQLVAF